MCKHFSGRLFALVMVLLLCLSSVTTALAGYNTIPYGEQSDDVRVLQNALKKKGYYSGAVDGKFGPNTKKAVIRFQRSVGLPEDGRPGDKTLTALYEGKSALNSTRDSVKKNTVQTNNPRSLYYGCSGSRVKALQRALRAAGVYKGAIDGIYGDHTYKAVLAYQYKKGLRPDGIAGVKTIASLNKTTKAGISYGFLMDVGFSGREVSIVRNFLNGLDYDTGETTSTYNESMVKAVKAWQEDTGKDVTGTISESQYNDIILGHEKKAQSAEDKPDTSKTDTSKTDTSKTDTSKTDTSKTDTSKSDTSK